MDEDQRLQIIIDAQDNASNVLNSVQQNGTAAFDKLQASATQSQGQLSAFDASIVKLNESMTAMDAAASPAAAAIEEAGAAAGAVAPEVDAAGQSFDRLGAKMESMGERMVLKMTVFAAIIGAFKYLSDSVKDAEAANENFTEAMKKSDEASNAFHAAVGEALAPAIITFREAITGAGESTAESAAKMKEFGLVVYDITNYVLAFGKTLELLAIVAVGALQIVVDAWKDMKATIAGTNEEVNIDIEAFKNTFNKSVDDITATVQKANGAGFDELFKKFTTGPAAPGKGAAALAAEVVKAGDAYDKLKSDGEKALAGLADAHATKTAEITGHLTDLQNQYETVGANAAQSLSDLAEKNTQSLATIDQQISDTQTKLADLATSFATATADRVNTLADAFVKAKDDAKTLQDQLNSWQTPDTIGKTQLSIAKLQQQLTQTNDSAQKTVLENEISIQQTSLQNEITNEDEKKKVVQDKLDTINTALANSTDLQKQYADQIAAAQKLSDDGVLATAINTFQTKQALAQTAYDQQKALLNQTLADEQAKRAQEVKDYNDKVSDIVKAATLKLAKIDEETAKYTLQQKTEQTLYDEKTKVINDILDTAEKARQEMNNKTYENTKSNVQKEIDLYNDLAQAISNANSAKGSQSMSIASNIPHMADGGIVNSPTVALIGEAGPEMVVPLNGKHSMGTNISIVINGDVSGEEIVQKVGDRLTRLLQLSTATV